MRAERGHLTVLSRRHSAANLSPWTQTDGRTRLEVRQWLPAHVTGATEEGWRQSFAELDAHLARPTSEAPR